jgi:hypothetical protein
VNVCQRHKLIPLPIVYSLYVAYSMTIHVIVVVVVVACGSDDLYTYRLFHSSSIVVVLQ